MSRIIIIVSCYCYNTIIVVKVFEAYKSASQALKSMRGNLTLENAEEVISEMRTAIDDGQDIDSLMAEGEGSLYYDNLTLLV